MRLLVGLAVIAALMSGPAFAGSQFQAYEGKNSILEGDGGTKVVHEGVEFWTTGAPPFRYQILGVITDTRGMGLFSGKAVGSGMAKRVKQLGGDGVVILDQSSEVSGAVMVGDNVALARRATTQMVVVKYLREAPPSQ